MILNKEYLFSCMNIIEIVGGPEIERKQIPDEEDFFEVTWELNETPSEEWDKKFETLIKKWFEKEEELFGPYKPKVIFTQLILAIASEKKVEEQKKFFEKEILEKVNGI